MVSNYKRKTDRGSYSKDKLREAVQAVRNGTLSGYKASQMYNIPRMTIMDHVNKRRTKSNTLGRTTALAPEAEARLANGLKLMEKYGLGLSRKEALETVGEYVEKNNISTNFKNGIPGQAWFSGFKKRQNLSIKKPQAVEYARKKAIDPFIVYPYFNLLKNTLEELNLMEKPEAIWNMDETSFSKDPEKTKIVGAKGHAATRVISSPGRDNTTVLLCGNALGEKAPPMIVYKGKNVWDSWVSPDAYPNTSYAATENGWMESDVFERYFVKTFLPAIGNRRPILLIYDGHATHVGLNIILKAREAGVTILKLPAHTSHVLQPLDVSVLKAFKNRWDELLVKWQRLNVGAILPKAEFARLIGEVWKEIDGQILKSGFRKAGIFPYNVDEIAENNFDSLKLQNWRKRLVTIATENSTTVATKHSATIATEISEKVVAKNTPKSLLLLALNRITRETTLTSIECNLSSANTRQMQENLTTASNEDSTRNLDRTASKIQILENKFVSFEDLLLMKVQPGNNKTVKRRKIAPGAEVITHEDVLKRKSEEQTKNIEKEAESKKGKGVGKKSHDREKENREKNINTSEAEGTTHKDVLKYKIKKQTKNIKKKSQTKTGKSMEEKNYDSEKENVEKKLNKPKVKKRSKVISPDSTSVSDCISIYSDSDAIDYDEDIFSGTIKESSMQIIEMGNKSKETKLLKIDPLHYGPTISKECFVAKKRTVPAAAKKDKSIKKEKKENNNSKLKVKKGAQIISSYTSVSDCVNIHSDLDVIECDENFFINMVTPIKMDEMENNKKSNKICNSSDRENKITMDSNTPDKGNETEKTEDENNFAINDHVLVRYYSRKKWIYYVGYVEESKAAEEVRYTVRFYKTIKSPLKFVLTKKRDCDDVPINSIIKKIHLIQSPNNSKEFVLSDNADMIYFS